MHAGLHPQAGRDMSNREMARQAHVSHPLVAKLRKTVNGNVSSSNVAGRISRTASAGRRRRRSPDTRPHLQRGRQLLLKFQRERVSIKLKKEAGSLSNL
jgi:hypothetical protein